VKRLLIRHGILARVHDAPHFYGELTRSPGAGV
jgi:hypothetical protein